MSQFHINKISLRTFNDALSRYPSVVPEKLQELDTLRYDTIPAQVASRQYTASLTKDEVEKLVEWKLKHGTFRPKLLSLVQSNSSETIIETTKKAFEFFGTPQTASPLPALKVLTELKGIGPATASLLLSALKPGAVPFFSDELLRWSCWDEPGSPGGWARKIKYNIKEYEQLVGRVEEVVKRLGVRAVDVEKVAWVLGREKIDVDVGEEGEEMKQANSNKDGEIKEKRLNKKTTMAQSDDVTEKPSQRASTKGTKRKAREPISPIEPLRKSTRTKK